ncbi:uncharacterized protein B0H18DRAFT_1211137 [Fomitopsis serialis]|uniref:uncharacterized protein n=1 Tax=Fomitopsis serialis TaxID=139415 RepID=UPI002007AEDE|nr:uncharacterized protein B0H18DRAFT_1211137 [Neoantrodia serialis]KAH9926115.1 hypothetical protein B0H18DRAFT_1211137 [Neoantrodia serialis]
MNGHVGSSNGLVNGSDAAEQGAYGDESVPSTSTGGASSVNGYAHPSPFQLHNDEILNHLYNAFQTGNYADTFLHVHQHAYRLHALIISRSPFLAHLMSTTPQPTGQCNIYLNLEQEPEVTTEGLSIALGYLYSSVTVRAINSQNAKAVLAAGCLLGGMDELCNYAYEICRQSIAVENISTWLQFVEAVPAPSNGTSTPIDQMPPPRAAIFGPFAQRLREDVFDFLVVTLPQTLNVGGLSTPISPHPDGQPSDAGRDTLLQIFALIPFDMFKAAVESPTFQIGSDQARFKFAKDAIELRKRGIARGQGAEETVVLAFGGHHGGSAVHVTRKLRKRPLWKVNA